MWHLNDGFNTSAGLVAAGKVGTGPDLVLAHGWPWSSYSWHRLIPTLAQRFCVHWFDMPGYGQSNKNVDQRTALDVQGEVFAEMLDLWELKQPSVIAHDFGGATTLRAHLLHGCEYQQYVLMNVVAMRPWGSEFFDHVGKHVDVFSKLPSHIHAAIVEAYIRGALVSDIENDDFSALAAPWLTEDGRHSFYRQFAQADESYTAEIEPFFSQVRCPVNIIWGEDDPWIPIDRGRELHKSIPNSTFDILHNTGHLPQLEAPDKVLKKLNVLL